MLTTVFPLLGAPSGSRELLFGSMPHSQMCSPAMYMDAIRMAAKAEPYDPCPAESMYWSAPALIACTPSSRTSTIARVPTRRVELKSAP